MAVFGGGALRTVLRRSNDCKIARAPQAIAVLARVFVVDSPDLVGYTPDGFFDVIVSIRLHTLNFDH